jgi:hypothetical protein
MYTQMGQKQVPVVIIAGARQNKMLSNICAASEA